MKLFRLFFALVVCVAPFAWAQNAALMPVPRLQFFDASGHPLAGGFVYTCTAGTSCAAGYVGGPPLANGLATFTDSTGATQNPNPVVLDAGGTASIWLGSGTYKILVQNFAGVAISTTDNVSSGSLGSTGATSTKGAFTVNGALTVAGSMTATGAANAPSFDNTQYADQFAGSDAGAKINAAIAALPATGGTVDARGFQGAQTAAATITIGKPVKLVLGAAAFVLSGNPGINLTSGSVDIGGLGWQQNPSSATILRSGIAAPLFAGDGISHVKVHDLELDGNNVGWFGTFLTQGSFQWYENVHAHRFIYTGVYALGGVSEFRDLWLEHNGEGLHLASDSVVDGQTSAETNNGPGIHASSGGNTIHCQSCDHNVSHGIYLDGRQWSAWVAQSAYTSYQYMLPTSNNAGGYMFMALTIGTSGTTQPTWPQTIGATVTDGSVTWINVSVVALANNIFVTRIVDSYADDNGYGEAAGTVSDNIRVEGSSVGSNSQIQISNTYTSQASAITYPARGVHLLNVAHFTVTGLTWLGSNYGGSGLDVGGLLIENSNFGKVMGFTSQYSAALPVALVNSNDISVVGAGVQSNASAGTSVPNSYCFTIDAASNRNQFVDAGCKDLRGTAYSRGINNLGNSTSIVAYNPSGLVASPDVFGTANVISNNGSGGMTLTPAPGQAVTLAGKSFFGAGAGSSVTQVQYQLGSVCTTAATIGSTCTSATQTWPAAFADGNYLLSCTLTTPTTGVPILFATAQTSSGFTVSLAAATAAAASASYACTAWHP